MKGWTALALGVIFLWVAAVLQMGVAPRLAIGEGMPDFILVTLACLGVYMNRRNATCLGFGAGVVQGALAGSNLTVYVISRATSGFLLGWFNALDVEVNAMLCVISSVVVTLAAQFLFMFLGGHHGPLTPYLAGTLTSAVYDGVIALPVYALLHRFLSAPSTRAD